jgi:hypothetical protein
MRISRFPSLVDDITVRLIAAVVLVVGAIALGTQQWWLYALLAADFTLRAALGPDASPVARFVRRALRPRIAAPPRPTAGPPKRFAAAIGAVMTGTATLLWLLAAATGSQAAGAVVVAIGVVMVVFPALEAFFGVCVGCILFSGLMRIGLVPDDVCLECADLSQRARAARSAAQQTA